MSEDFEQHLPRQRGDQEAHAGRLQHLHREVRLPEDEGAVPRPRAAPHEAEAPGERHRRLREGPGQRARHGEALPGEEVLPHPGEPGEGELQRRADPERALGAGRDAAAGDADEGAQAAAADAPGAPDQDQREVHRHQRKLAELKALAKSLAEQRAMIEGLIERVSLGEAAADEAPEDEAAPAAPAEPEVMIAADFLETTMLTPPESPLTISTRAARAQEVFREVAHVKEEAPPHPWRDRCRRQARAVRAAPRPKPRSGEAAARPP